MRCTCYQRMLMSLVALTVGILASNSSAFQSDPHEGDSKMLAMIEQKLEDDPLHSDSWRLLGKILARQGSSAEAIDALRRSIELRPENVAAHYDLGKLLQTRGDSDASEYHFKRVIELAPQCPYAQRLRDEGFDSAVNDVVWQPSNDDPSPTPFIGATALARMSPELAKSSDAIEPVGYEIQTFDGAARFDRQIDHLETESYFGRRRLRFLLETGALYNSNVTLTPISRELAQSDASGAQWFANPDLEFALVQNDGWRIGPLARGYFTVNESAQQAFDLSSYQGGLFLERTEAAIDGKWTGRLDYTFSSDAFGGSKIGDRHALVGSWTRIPNEGSIANFYASINTSDFADDGPTPVVTSLDGTTYTVGLNRFFLTGDPRLPMWNVGADLEKADIEGANFRYDAIRFRGQATVGINACWSAILSGAAGYRWYSDFTGPVDRDEFTWRAEGELKYQIRPAVSVSLVTNYDRFASDNSQFDVDRWTAGIITEWRY